MDSRTRRLITLLVLAALVIAVLVGALLTGGKASAAESGSAEQQLADRYAPYVVVRVQDQECGPGEPYRPVPVDSVLGDPAVVLRGPDGAVVARAPRAEDLAGRGNGYYLDFPGDPLDPGCDFEEWFRTKRDVPTAVHARIVRDPSNPEVLVLQYWFWWVFNDWNDKHEGDWEMIQILFPATSAQQAMAVTPTEVAFAQHEGSEVASWGSGKLLRSGDHVAVYPGQGSHAAYYTQAQWFGKSAAAGFGCDNTGVSDGVDAAVLEPIVVLVDGSESWLEFEGRWGQKAPSFNNGPTGPNTKDQWTQPVDWQVTQGRPSAVGLPTVLSAAESAFCALTATGSQLFIDLLASPVLTITGLLMVVAVVVLLLRATTWRGSPPEPDRERTAGQILLGPVGILRRHALRYAGVTVALMVFLAASYWAQALLLRPAETTDLTRVGAPSDSAFAAVLVTLTAGATAVLAAFALAYSVAVTARLPEPSGREVLLAAATRRGVWRTLLSYAVILLCFVTVVLIPLAIYLIARWAVASPAAVIEDLAVGPAGGRSSRLTKGLRWRSLAIVAGIGAIATAPGALVGGVLLLVTSLPFWVVNMVVIVTTAAAMVLAAIGTTLHFFDLRARVQACTTQPLAEESAL